VVTTKDNDNVLMKDTSPSSKNSSDKSKNKQADGKQDEEHLPSSKQSQAKDEEGFDNTPF